MTSTGYLIVIAILFVAWIATLAWGFLERGERLANAAQHFTGMANRLAQAEATVRVVTQITEHHVSANDLEKISEQLESVIQEDDTVENRHALILRYLNRFPGAAVASVEAAIVRKFASQHSA